MKTLTLKPIASFLILATTPALAVDLTKAKLPLHYECRVTHGGGIWLDEGGEWKSGSFKFDKRDQKTRYVLERYSETTGTRFESCEQEQKTTGGLKAVGFEFCLTEKSLGSLPESTSYCLIAPGSRDSSSIYCRDARLHFDTDRRVMVSSSSVAFQSFPRKSPLGVFKYDCERLDR